MDNPFKPDAQNPFQTPYQPPGASGNPNQALKPFPAVDLAPAAHQSTTQSMAPSPFLEGALSKAFTGRDNSPSPNGAAHAALGTSPFTNKPNTLSAPVDFSPAPMAPPMAPQVQAPRPQPMEFNSAPMAPQAQAPRPQSMEFNSAPMTAYSPMVNQAPANHAPMPSPNNLARQSSIIPMADMDRIFKPEFFLTSTATVDGYSIESYLGLVSIEVVVPKDLLFRNPAPHGELHRLKAAEDQLQRVKVTALEELSARAKGMGADGVVGLTLQFSQFDTIVCLCSAVGTAVKLSG